MAFTTWFFVGGFLNGGGDFLCESFEHVVILGNSLTFDYLHTCKEMYQLWNSAQSFNFFM